MACAALALAAICIYFAAGFKESRQVSAVDRAVGEAMDWDMADVSMDFFVPYNSTAFSPTDVPRGRAAEDDISALKAFLTSMEIDKKATLEAPECKGNTLISITVPKGDDRLVVTVTDGELCFVQLSQGKEWLSAVYSFDGDAREALLARGGLPSVEEIHEGVENRFREIENGDKDKEPPLK